MHEFLTVLPRLKRPTALSGWVKSGIPSPVTCIAQTRKLVPKSIMYPSDPTGRELTGSRPVVALITRRARSSSPHWTEMSPTTISANICGGPLRVQPVVQEFKSWLSGGEQLIVQKGNHGGKRCWIHGRHRRLPLAYGIIRKRLQVSIWHIWRDGSKHPSIPNDDALVW